MIGESGVLALEGGAPRGFQSGLLRLSLNGRPQPVEAGKFAAMPDAAANVAAIYAALRDDIANGTSTASDFHHGVRLARLIEDATMSARMGMRKQAAEWPLA